MPTDIDREIQQLITELEELRVEFNNKSNRITRKLNKLSRKVKEAEVVTDELKLGDTVRITNNYQGDRGITGIIERVTNKQVLLRNQNTKRQYVRSKLNVELVE
jgi:tyrosine-protein phosphatase YwqE